MAETRELRLADEAARAAGGCEGPWGAEGFLRLRDEAPAIRPVLCSRLVCAKGPPGASDWSFLPFTHSSMSPGRLEHPYSTSIMPGAGDSAGGMSLTGTK